MTSASRCASLPLQVAMVQFWIFEKIPIPILRTKKTTSMDLTPAITTTIYENQRYSAWGWGPGALLVTDRPRFSTADGKVGWATLEEVDAALSCPGWEAAPGGWSSPNESDDITCSNSGGNSSSRASNDDGDAALWRYGHSFKGAVCCEHSHAEKGALDFVRRRRLTRTSVWTGHGLLLLPTPGRCGVGVGVGVGSGGGGGGGGGGCGRMDAEAVGRLGDLLLGAFARASLARWPREGAVPEDPRAAADLKRRLYRHLGILLPAEAEPPPPHPAPPLPAADTAKQTDQKGLLPGPADKARCDGAGVVLGVTPCSEGGEDSIVGGERGGAHRNEGDWEAAEVAAVEGVLAGLSRGALAAFVDEVEAERPVRRAALPCFSGCLLRMLLWHRRSRPRSQGLSLRSCRRMRHSS